ncbi:MAG: thioredoxin [Burkholderiales bacterium]|nr:thioredoxin [Burkholderiales bacterium]
MIDAALIRVACLCAQWCGVCGEYAAVFEQAAAAFGARCTFVWIDIEDEAELVGDVDVENFPTLLIARGDRALFFGTVTPHPQTIARLVQSALDGGLEPPADTAEIDALARRVSARGGR